jgi:hypothetical protein
MSIQEAIVNATKDILSSYLAPELVEQLSDDIMHRAAPDIETALNAFAGFDFGKSASMRAKNAGTASVRKGATRGRKRKDALDGESQDDNGGDMRNTHDDAGEPAPADMA